MTILEWFPYALFFLAIAIFHWWVCARDWSRKRWLIAEYFWLGVAGFTLISMSTDIGREWAEGQLPWQRGLLESRWNDLAWAADTYASWYEVGGLYEWQREHPKTGKFFIEFVSWARKVEAAAQKKNFQRLAKLQREGDIKKEDGPQILRHERGRVLQNIVWVMEKKVAVENLDDKMEGGILSGLTKLLLIFFFPIALALRITKATAGYCNRLPK